jgi:hypothetical protein
MLRLKKFSQRAVATVQHNYRAKSSFVQAGDQHQGRLVAAADGITDKRVANSQQIGNVKRP